jgi:nitrogenase molybdenum-cofactor synthesis protein NifE
MALALSRYGFHITELYANVSPDDFVYLNQLAVLSPDTQVFSNLSPSMLYYEGNEHPVDLTIGKDAAYYHPHSAHVFWNEEVQPFGYDGVTALLHQIREALEGRRM